MGGQGPRVLARTKPIAPSKLGAFKLCPLRYLLETERPPTPCLPVGILALRGTAVHHAIEKFAGLKEASGVAVKGAILDYVHKSLARMGSPPLMRLAYEAVGASGLLSPSEVVKHSQFALKMIQASPPVVPRTMHAGPIDGVATTTAAVLGPEKWFESGKLGMAGKIDSTFRASDGGVHVVDYKTGGVLAEDGSPKEEYLLQVAAYGVMVRHATGALDIRLRLVGPSSSWDGCLDAGMESLVETIATELQATIPIGKAVETRGLATLGQHCSSCSYRPSCGPYNELLLRRLGNETSDAFSPLDLAGIIDTVSVGTTATSVRVTATSGGAAAITGLPNCFYPRLDPGAAIIGYGLGCQEVRMQSRRPSNFFVYRADEPRLSAFGSLIVVG